MQSTVQARNRQYQQVAANLYDIEDPGPNDVLFGRGTGSNMHSGNIRFRALIQKYKSVYRDTPKKMKPSVSTKVVALWRAQDPPGRFLTRSDRFHGSRRTFYDVGDAMARRKAAQCLREKSTKERIQQQVGGIKEETAEKEETDAPAATTQESATGIQEDDTDLFAGSDFLDASNSSSSSNASNEFLSIASALGINTAQAGPGKILEDDFPTGSSFLDHSNATKTDDGNNNETMTLLKTLNLPTADDFDNMKLPDSLKVVASKYKDDGWMGGASKQENKNNTLSLMDVYAAESENESTGERPSDSPFLFASFDLGTNNNKSGGDGDDNGGLMFPSLLGASDSNTEPTSLFGGEDNGTEDDDCAFPSLAPAQPSKRENALHAIGDTMPTAEALTTAGIFDF
ncbi:expressed unknown protein [Seminavis robusta]|uniref:DUF6824 domain-containing protein n=1 Tax=Seminavis robusta TaxID=568900 RepID=A0A9N8DPU1_9STRA|nr:expressed unknown protein [Seminavis robusta]|eukprot:Sro200_g084610.1 n/a (400) ;mRNA; f:19237-20704